MDKVEIMLKQARMGRLGTPEKPSRSNSLHSRFWDGFFGYRSPDEFEKGSTAWACCKAGKEWRL